MVGATAAGAGFALGLSLPSESDALYAADGLPEVDAWVVIRPDETVVIRIMRSEMGQAAEAAAQVTDHYLCPVLHGMPVGLHHFPRDAHDLSVPVQDHGWVGVLL